MTKKGYASFGLPSELIEELKVWRMAFTAAYGKQITYSDIIRGMLDSLEDTEPGVVKEMDLLLEKHPELKEKLANRR